MKRTPFLFLFVLTLAAGASAEAQRALLFEDLTVAPITRLLTLSDQSVEVEEPDGSIRRFDTDRAIAITQTVHRTIRPLDGEGWVELVDGQRIVGRSADLASDTESVAWMTRDFGVLWIPLERVSRLVPRGAPALSQPAVDSARGTDVVHLINGDAIEGYLLHVGEDITLELDDGTALTTPLERIASIRLANPDEAPVGTYLWLSDGSILAVASIIDVTGERVQTELRTGEIAVLMVSQILGVSLQTQSLFPLSSAPLQRHALPDSRRWSPTHLAVPAHTSLDSPLLFAGDIIVPGPMTLRWSFPRGTTGFGTVIEMPSQAFPWGDCEVVLRSGNDEIFRVRVNEDSPRHAIAVELPAADLEIEVLAGQHGPINDTIRLIAPLVRSESR